MKISYNWLKEYIDIDLAVDRVSEILTDIGLEVEGIEKVEAVKGGLDGIVIGQIKSVVKHPDADRLQLTKVDVGHSELLDIVCGAPNVAENQKVVVALVGTSLYPDEKGFKIKKSKIRGKVSEGMLCAEDELGIGVSHDGIIEASENAVIGQAAAEYFNLENDVVFEIGLTPNRVDAASHFGVARDLASFLKMSDAVKLKKPSINSFKVESEELNIAVTVENELACPRYSSLSISNVQVKPSPEWLQKRLRAIGIKPTNNIVDATNYVLHEIGQPLHAFDADKIIGNEVFVKTVSEKSMFTTLDGEERELSGDDLMICNAEKPMCIAGVLGGSESGVSDETKNIFLESAYFHPVGIRKTAKRHGLNTDASFRYERGADPDGTIYALKRAALLIQEVAGGTISSEISDHYPNPIEDFLVEMSYEKCDALIGKSIDRKVIKKILESLEIKILHESKAGLRLSVPAYRVDVQREVDVIEEILRIYGYNRIPMPSFLRTSILTNPKHSPHKLENTIGNYLAANGLNEIFTNSLTNPAYYEDSEDLVEMVNPLSQELKVMRKSMLSGGMEVIAYNQNRKRKNLKLFEFGKTYRDLGNSKFEETKRLAIWLSGSMHEESWKQKAKEVDFYFLKELVQNIVERIGLSKIKTKEIEAAAPFIQQLSMLKGKSELVKLGEVNAETLKKFDVKEKVFFAEFNWSAVSNSLSNKEIQHKAVVKFPSVRRDLALLLDTKIDFKEVNKIARQAENRLLKEVNLFDVYEGDKMEKGKKSYGVSFVFQDEQKTLTDIQIDKIMNRLIDSLKKELGAELR